ncbi:MAG: hypothetical protein OEN23_17070 [Paracoccaceae bacterium]|nr:hypothetical protein [Paracoccaceae bacterium]
MPLWRVIAIAVSIGLVVSPGPALAGGQGRSHGQSSHGHAHGGLREAPAGLPAPGLTVEAIADPGDGYNLNLIVQNFAFSPEHAGQPTEAVEGHAHLYVNGAKIGRVYGPWVHLPDKLLAPGENEIRISLNDNTHRAWSAGGKPVEARLTLQGLREVTADANGETAPVIVVDQGDRVRLTIHGAGTGVLHFHGYDLEARAVDGEPAILKFHAHHNGRFPVMTHVHDKVLGEQEKALLFVEVRTR